VALATPLTVVALDVNAAFPLSAQGDVNLTSNGTADGCPPEETVTLKPVVPNADSVDD
jgi:hypothetical protein